MRYSPVPTVAHALHYHHNLCSVRALRIPPKHVGCRLPGHLGRPEPCSWTLAATGEDGAASATEMGGDTSFVDDDAADMTEITSPDDPDLSRCSTLHSCLYTLGYVRHVSHNWSKIGDVMLLLQQITLLGICKPVLAQAAGALSPNS